MPLLVTPVGPAAEPPYLLRRMTALSPTFQQFSKSLSTADALRHVFFKEVEGDEPKPCGVVNSESTVFTKIAGGDQAVMVPKGALFLWLALDTPVEYYEDPTSEYLNYLNFHGGIGQDIANLSGLDQTEDTLFPDSHLLINEMHEMAPSLNPKELWPSMGRFYWSAWIVNWGSE